MLEEIYIRDEALSEDDYYDALIYLLGDIYPDLSEEELEDMAEDILDELPEEYAENFLQTIGNIGKNIGNGAMNFAANHPGLVKGAATLAGTFIGGPVGAKVGNAVGGWATDAAQRRYLPRTAQTLSLMQNPQTQAALARTSIGLGNGAAPLAINGEVAYVSVSTHLRAIMQAAQAALQEVDRYEQIPPAELTNSFFDTEDIDEQAEWLLESLVGNNYENPFKILYRDEDGYGIYHTNHFIAYFDIPGVIKGKEKEEAKKRTNNLLNEFVKYFNSKDNLAEVSKGLIKCPCEGKITDTFVFKFLPNRLSDEVKKNKAKLIEYLSLHFDWVAIQMPDDKETFFATTLRKEIDGNLPIPADIDWFDNERHFLAGKRSWKIGYDEDKKLYFIETVGYERFSSHKAAILDSQIAGREVINIIWGTLLKNYIEKNNFKAVDTKTVFNNEKNSTRNYNRIKDKNIYSFALSFTTHEEALHSSWFKKLYDKHCGLENSFY